MDTNQTIIIGAGLAGLCCARQLHAAGANFLLLDAADAVGGRVRTDVVDGFKLDRGFQVLLTAYPEAARVLDYHALDLRPFYPGALVRFNGAFHRVADPWRRPVDGVLGVATPIGSVLDKARVGLLRTAVQRGSLDELFARPATTTEQRLHNFGFSSAMIDRFFRPFLGGVLLNRELNTTSRMFDFVFRMFAQGDTSVPADGIEAIPWQIAESLPGESIRLNTRVASLDLGEGKREVVLEGGERLSAQSIVVAVEGPSAARLLAGSDAAASVDVPNVQDPGSVSVTCLYFAAPNAPDALGDEPILVLNGDGVEGKNGGPINSFHIASSVAPSYATNGQALISATVLGETAATYESDEALEYAVRAQLSQWFGSEAQGWRHLRTYHIAHAQPQQPVGRLSPPRRPVALGNGLFVCGDHRDTASINGAMVSGRRAAEAVLEG